MLNIKLAFFLKKVKAYTHTQREREREIPLRQKKVRVEGQIGRPLLWLWVQMDLGFALRGNLCDEV